MYELLYLHRLNEVQSVTPERERNNVTTQRVSPLFTTVVLT